MRRERARAACARARFFANYTYGGIKRVLERTLDQQPLPAVVLLYAPAGQAPVCPATSKSSASVARYNVLCTSAHAMLTQLRASRADDSYDRKMLRFTMPHLLDVDDLGLRALTGAEPLDTSQPPPLRAWLDHPHVLPRDPGGGPALQGRVSSPAPPWTACFTTPTLSRSTATPSDAVRCLKPS